MKSHTRNAQMIYLDPTGTEQVTIHIKSFIHDIS